MKQLIVLVATIILGLSIGGTVVNMKDGVKDLSDATKNTIESRLLDTEKDELSLTGLTSN